MSKYTMGVDGRLYNGKGTKGGLAAVPSPAAIPSKAPTLPKKVSKATDGIELPSIDLINQIHRLDAHVAAIDNARANPPATDLSVPWEIFARQCRLLTPQAYGPRFEKYFMNAFGWTKVSPRENRGDIKDADGNYYEVKTTVISPSNPGANFVQLRPHQDITGYHLFVVDENYQVTHMTVSKAHMNAEIVAFGSTAHGSVEAREGNVNHEYAIRFDWTPSEGHANTWINRYLAPDVPEGHVLAPYMSRHPSRRDPNYIGPERGDNS